MNLVRYILRSLTPLGDNDEKGHVSRFQASALLALH